MRGWKKVFLWTVILLAVRRRRRVHRVALEPVPAWGSRSGCPSEREPEPVDGRARPLVAHDVQPDDAHVSRGRVVHERLAPRRRDRADRSRVASTGAASRDSSPARSATSHPRRSRPGGSWSRSSGVRDGDELDLRFQEAGRKPAGSQDLGGFLKTLETLRFSIPERAGAEASKPKRIEDPEGEVYASVTTIRLGR